MAGDELDLSEFEEFSETAKKRARSGASEAPGGRGRKEGRNPSGGRKRRRWPWFLAGLILGVVAAVFGPELAGPYLPAMLQAGSEEVTGPVVGKRVADDRVLLTVDTEQGAVLATFRQRVPEIDLLVEEGDTVTLGIPAYAPLVEDPSLAAVRKGPGPEVGAGQTSESSGRTSGGAAATSEGSEGSRSPDSPVPDTGSESSSEPDSVTG